MNQADTAWMLVSTALVLLMTPALAFFYGGLVRRKNVLSTIMHSFFILCLISVQWVLWGYTLAFGDAENEKIKPYIGGTQYLFAVDSEPGRLYKLTLDGRILDAGIIATVEQEIETGRLKAKISVTEMIDYSFINSLGKK